MEKSTESSGMGKWQRLHVTRHRNRIGCDVCRRKNTPTQAFIGYCGDVLWICNKCFKRIVEVRK